MIKKTIEHKLKCKSEIVDDRSNLREKILAAYDELNKKTNYIMKKKLVLI